MQFSHSEVVLKALNQVYALDDVQEIVDKVCECVAAVSSYDIVLLSLYFGEDVYIGLEGGSERMRRRFLETARATSEAARAQKRSLIWDNHRIPDTNICFIPQGSAVPFGASFTPSSAVAGAQWQPQDRLMVFVRGMDGEARGVLSLDVPRDGRRPDPDDLGPLEAIDHLMKLMGVLIHNKHLSVKLKESEERYAAVVEQGHDAILIERDSRILFVNRRMARMAGVDRNSVVGRPVDSLIRVNDKGSLPGELEGHVLRADGREVDVALRLGTIRFGDGEATLVAAADITERKRILAQLMRSQKMDSVGTLASGIAHDFNNLLSGIVGYASLLRMQMEEGDPAFKYVQSIERAADSASAVTRQLLGIVRDEPVRVAAFRFDGLLEDLARLLRETFDPSISVVVNAAADLPLVLGDETQIHQVLLNACLNARDAMPRGGTLTLSADRAVNGNEKSMVRCVLRDTGCGMDRKTLSRVFDPFFTTKGGGQGTGLGLYMAYRVIDRHGGTIDITSEPGVGTVLEIVLPATVAPARTVAEPADVTVPQGGTVLLVDDEELIRSVGKEMLQRLGYRVVLANDGLEAVHAVEESAEGFCCVVLDISMPIMDGWEAARRIRDLQPDLPIIVSSGHDAASATGDTRGLDVAEFLKKPYRLADLAKVLHDVLDVKTAR